jgi:hypothetical protein
MKTKLPLCAVLALSLCVCEGKPLSDSRSVRLGIADLPTAGPLGFDPAQSTALFVGIGQFNDSRVADVKYAADDAVDLAYAFSLERKDRLVHPSRIVLALSGQPHKNKSRWRLALLRANSATVVRADGPTILDQLTRQARLAGKDGIFIVSFATHGFSDEGVPYVFTASSLLNDPASSLSTAKILELVGASPAARSLVFLDACRERIRIATRGIQTEDSPSAAPLVTAMKRVTGQVVFYAAAAGKYAYDDDKARNGVFTAAVLDGLRCKAQRDGRGFITASTLFDYADASVRTWIRNHKREPTATAIQISMDGRTSDMPLATCGPPSPPAQPAYAAVDGTALTVYGRDGMKLWSTIAGPVIHNMVKDLNGDKTPEVIIAVGSSITVYHASGDVWWTTDTTAPANYDNAPSGPMIVHTFITEDLYRDKNSEVVVLSRAEGGTPSRLTILSPNGVISFGYWHPGPIDQVLFGARTARTAPKLILAGTNTALNAHTVFLFDPAKISGEAPPYEGRLATGSELWYGQMQAPIDHIDTIDHNNDRNLDIAVHTRGFTLLAKPRQ